MSEPSEKADRAGTSDVATLPGTFALTDLGNAERLVARYRDRIRYCAQRRKWLLWEGSRWRWDDTAAIERMAKATARKIYDEAGACNSDEQRSQIAKHARSTESGKRLRDMVSLAQSEAGVPVLLADLDADAWLLNAANGTINLRTGELRAHRREDLITRSAAIDFLPGKRSELWERVLHDATGGDVALASYLQRVVGYSLIGDPLERALFFLFGPPGTAKSTLVIAFHAALGDYVHAASFETWLVQSNTGGNRGDLVRLAGSRLVTSVEVRAGARFDEALVKAVTGGDEIVAAAKYEAEVSFRPSFTLILAANDAPAAREDDAGLWARMRRIPLTAVIAPERQDPTIKGQLREPQHAEAVLAWAVAGCLAYQKQGLGTCSAVEQSTNEYRAELDHFSEFLSDCLVLEPAGRMTRKDLRERYAEWAEEVGRKSLLSARDVATKLRARGCEDKMVKGTRLWFGVRARMPIDSAGGAE